MCLIVFVISLIASPDPNKFILSFDVYNNFIFLVTHFHDLEQLGKKNLCHDNLYKLVILSFCEKYMKK